MSAPVRRDPFGRLPDLLDWLDTPFGLRQGGHTIRVEESVKDDRYTIRAELPGVTDPDKQIEISVSSGLLSIRAEREEEQHDKHRSEFRYGSFSRSLVLPPGVHEEDVHATYDKGILEVSFALPGEKKAAAKRIQIKAKKETK